MFVGGDARFNALGEHRDPERERAFREGSAQTARGILRRNALLAGTAYLGGALPFALHFGSTVPYWITNVPRVAVFVVCLLVAFDGRPVRDRATLDRWATAIAWLASLGLLPMFLFTPVDAHLNGTLAGAVIVTCVLFVEVPIRSALVVGVFTTVAVVATNTFWLRAGVLDVALVALVVVALGLMSVVAAARLGRAQRETAASLDAQVAAVAPWSGRWPSAAAPRRRSAIASRL